MEGLRLIIARVFRPDALWVALWVGLGVFTIVLISLLRTRLGNSRPLQKCTILAVWFHLLLLIYASSVTIVAERPGVGNQVTINLSSGEVVSPRQTHQATPTKPRFTSAHLLAPPKITTLPQSAAPRARVATSQRPSAIPAATLKKPAALDIPAPASTKLTSIKSPPAPLPSTPQSGRAVTLTPPSLERPKPQANLAKIPTPSPLKASKLDTFPKISQPAKLDDLPDPLSAVAVPKAAAAPQPQNAPDAMTPIPQASPLSASPSTASAARLLPVVVPPPVNPNPAETKPEKFIPPQLYQQRIATDKEQLAQAHGGSQKTEAAVKAALKWLAAHQEPDGRWSPGKYGAGQESEVLGHNRGGAGAHADTGITGLALLALLGAGHTNARGDYQATVERALGFLVASQHPNGNLGGDAEPFAFMYCHGMATLALSEALAMTNDERLREPVRRAIGYTLAAQNRVTGGWRYRPMEAGDLSQLGWQLMSLKSAELAGIETPSQTRDGMIRFVTNVSSGRQGGLASYRAGEQVSKPMTAEALVCKQFLGLPRQNPAGDEAGDFLLEELPGRGERNYYYWYYGTLGMYQLQGDHWRRWNEALTGELLGSQNTAGDLAGSWEPNDVWGGYGGRVYSTALATLCLEVYYRYLPLYVEAASNGGDAQRK